MNIVQVIHSHTVGGAERHVVDLSQELSERGHRVFLACPNRGWLWDAVQGTAVTPVHVAMDGLLDQNSVGRLTRLVRQVRAHVIHAHLTRGAYFAVKAGRRARVPVLATAHTTYTYKHYAGADRVLCVSRAAMENLLSHDVPRHKLHVVHNGIRVPAHATDAATIARLRAEWDVPPGARVVGMLARLTPDKGIDTLLEVAARWKEERPDVRFVIAGTGNEDTERELRFLAEALGANGAVRFLGMVEDPSAVLASYDVLAAPSRRESFPLTLLEAMAIGTPVVASEVGGTPEMVTHGETGLLVPPDNPEQLAEGLARALDAPEIPAMIAEARRTVEERFSLPGMTSDIEAHYRDLAK